jgi:hypothetical protein
MITVWFADDGAEAPEPVECETPGYPRRDVQGRTMYVNSHFATEAAAWEVLQDRGRASQDCARIDYENAQRQLQRCTEALATAAARRSRIDAAYAEFKREQRARQRVHDGGKTE